MPTKEQRAAKKRLIADLIASIQNESRHFGMDRFRTLCPTASKQYLAGKPATCGTASCMAGHLQAIRQPLAKRIIAEQWAFSPPPDETLADLIWERETGEPCPLDFLALGIDKEMSKVTRADAIAHIRGRSKRWPLRNNVSFTQTDD